MVFDYSGTLSKEMARFATPEHLMNALERSGLSLYGIHSPEDFWERIVNPTWMEGAKTPLGYVRIITRAIGKEGDSGLQKAAERFVKDYMDNSKIDEAWLPLIRWLLSRRKVTIVIASDHYAEATQTIVREFARVGIEARTAKNKAWEADKRSVVVANSADIGYFKEEPEFWKVVKDSLMTDVGQVILVDDFGGAEVKGDAYREKISERYKKTIAAIEGVFNVPLTAIVYPPSGSPKEVEKKIKEEVKRANAIVSRAAH